LKCVVFEAIKVHVDSAISGADNLSVLVSSFGLALIRYGE